MRSDYTYQQDTMSANGFSTVAGSTSENNASASSRQGADSIAESSVSGKAVSNYVKTVPAYTSRMNVWRREQKLLVGDSRYIEPRTNMNLYKELVAHESIHLPIRPINAVGYDWITLILLISLVLFASVRTTWGQYMNSLFHSIVNYATSIRMFQEKNNSLLQAAFLLDVLFYMIFSVFMFQMIDFFRVDVPYQHINLFLLCMVVVLAFFVGKKVLYKFMGALIEKKGETLEFLFNADNHKRVAGLVLIPIVTAIAFYPFNNIHIPLIFGILIISIIYSLLILRGFEILIRKQFSIFYLFLYFCTLEFLPLVLLYKILVV